MAIARSIVKKPKILILDEATSAIDVRGERIVQAALNKVSKNRTTITIAHRLSTIIKADNIVVLKKGQVVQQGTHEDLLKDQNGPYLALVNAQQLGKSAPVRQMQVVTDPEKQTLGSPSFERISLDVENTTSVDSLSLPPKKQVGSFLLFLWEQKPRWGWYTLMFLSSLSAGGKFQDEQH